VTAAMKKWSRCLAAAGYSYQTPKAANDDPRFAGPTASPEEKKTALADVRCKQQTHLVDIMAAVETRVEGQQIDANRHDLDLVAANIAELRSRVAGAAVAGRRASPPTGRRIHRSDGGAAA